MVIIYLKILKLIKLIKNKINFLYKICYFLFQKFIYKVGTWDNNICNHKINTGK
ncbi:hypothetical protein GUU_03551 [Malacoplasma iowae 695]|nr:hypothetical protein GUU_03551 [Malacoplasma iowae 695]